MKNIFIDGSAGTTGLKINERLLTREDINLITLPEEKRKDTAARSEALNDADVVFLCLPDDAAIEAVSMVKNENTVIIDTSTAHRTAPRWVYGFPELDDEIEKALPAAKRIAVPGCHACGFVSLVAPLVKEGIIKKDALLTCHSLTGFSGGGKKMIVQYNYGMRSPLFLAPRQYGLSQQHKHLREMKALTGLDGYPIFCPIVADYYSGMEVTVPVFEGMLNKDIEAVKELYKNKYNGKIVRYREADDGDGMLASNALSGIDAMEISVFGSDGRYLLVSRFDNLGKGASGAAIECLNYVLGCDITEGLVLTEGYYHVKDD